MFNHHERLSQVLRIFLGGMCLLLSIEVVILLIFNPSHVLGTGDISGHIFTLVFLLTHRLLWVAILLLELICAFLLALLIAQPLALFAHLRIIQEVQKSSHIFFPLTALPILTLQSSHQDTIDLTPQNQGRKVSILDLLQQRENHQLLLGVPGAGKTTVLNVYQYNASKRRWAILLGRNKLPVYVPMNDYNLFLKEHLQVTSDPASEAAEEGTLLDYLSTRDRNLPGMRYIRPYLKKLMKQGRLLFLCDGLNEVDSEYLAFVSTKLSQLMHQTPMNRIVMTCREVDYCEKPQLNHLMDSHSVTCLLINPLEHEQIEEFIEEYLKKSDEPLWHIKEEMMEIIDISSLRPYLTNPMMLAILIQIFEGPDLERGKQFDTRGHLMNEFVPQLIRSQLKKPEWSEDPPRKEDVMLFLSEVAYAARQASNRNAIQLQASTATEGVNRTSRYQELADALQSWLYKYPVQVPFALDEETSPLADYMPQLEQFDQGTLTKLIKFALSAGLIDIDTTEKLIFRHEIIAEYFVARYFWTIDSIRQPPLPLSIELLKEVGRWSEPVTIWAELLDNPIELAKRFATLGKSNPTYMLEAVTLSLNCIGVLWTPAYFQAHHQAVLPTIVEEALAFAVRNADARAKLATIFDDFAQKGGHEVYLSLLPLLTFPGIDDLLVRLDKTVVPRLLFEHLEEIVEDITREDHVKALMRVLRQFGAISVEHAAMLSQTAQSGRLRAAAINILGGTDEQSAVEPLITCLSDTNAFIYKRAISALIRLGPEHVLSRIIQELEDRTPTDDRPQVHQAALFILQRFLTETRPERQVTALQYQRIMQVIIPLLSSIYAPEDQQLVREILKQQCLSSKESENTKQALEVLIRNLSTSDELMARNIVQVLQEVGIIVTPALLDHLPQASEIMRMRTIEVFEGVRDLHALPQLLRLVADSSSRVRQRVARVLRVYAPESIPSLIQQILSDNNELIAEKSASILGDIGVEVVKPVMGKLFPIKTGRTHLLVRVLERIHDPQAIPGLIDLLETPHEESLLTQAVIHALSQYQDKRVVPPLLKILASPNPLFYEEAMRVLIQLGNVALDELITALAVEEEPTTIIRIKHVLYYMVPFPSEQLIDKVAHASDAQLQHIMDVFLMKEEEGTKVLVRHLEHPDARIQSYVRHTLGKIETRIVIPVILSSLDSSAWHPGATEFLLRHPEEAIPQLVDLLSDAKRGAVAETILLGFDPEVLSTRMPGLDALITLARIRRNLVDMVSLPGFERRLRVFLSHSSNDESVIRKLYQRLQADHVDPWLPEENLLPGQDWQREIANVVRDSDLVMVCLSRNSIIETGATQREIEFVLGIADERPEETKAILPLRLEECDIPERLKRWQRVDLFEEQGYERLLRALSLRANQVLGDYYWKNYQIILHQTLYKKGIVDPSVFPDIPINYVDGLLKRYFQEHRDADLEYQENIHSLLLRTAVVIQRIESLFEPVVRDIADGILTDNIKKLEYHMEKILQEFSIPIGLKIVGKQSYKDFAAFFIDTGMIFENIQISNPLPFFVSPEHEISDEAIEHLRRLLFRGEVGSETQVAILILFCDKKKLNVAQQRIANILGDVYARDIVVINHEYLLEIVAAKEPEEMLCSCVLSQMNLIAIAPYTETGPTPPHFFFGREHERREISDRLANTSYILIGSRLIGKTSILNCLHCERLPDYGYHTLFLDCSLLKTYDAFLSAPLRNWKPEPPLNAPSTVSDLLQLSPDNEHLVLLLDEADKLVPIDRKNGWQIFNTLRAMINSRNIQVVLSGERTLRDALKDPASPLFNFANLRILGPLDYKAVEKLVSGPMKKLGIEIANQTSIVDHIYEFTSGHPNVVQRLCLRLIERLNKRGIRCITLDDVKAITQDPHFQEYDFLQVYWEGATPLEKIITLVLSYEVRGYHLGEVRQFLSERAHIQPNATDTKDALDRLVELRSIFKHTEIGYEFAVKGFPLVLDNTMTLEDMLGVLVEEYNKKEYNKVEYKE